MNAQAPFMLRPQGEMTIYTAQENKSLLMDALVQHADVQVDLSQVNEIDTAGLQLLILAKREASRLAHSVTFTDHSAAVLDVIQLLDVAGLLGDPLVIPHGEDHRRTSA